MDRTLEDLLQIVRNGGCLDIDASGFVTKSLVQLAAHAHDKGVKITLRNIGDRSTNELVQIARNGNGCVVFVA